MPTEPQSQPLVSIIVPVYNAADHIARCIESIRRQTYRNLEIILLNDGSKDVSYAVCQSYAGIDRRIVVIDKNNSGVSATRNLGMQEAHGKYFQFVDADDFIQPYATELLVQKAEASHADMVIAHYNRIEPPEPAQNHAGYRGGACAGPHPGSAAPGADFRLFDGRPPE